MMTLFNREGDLNRNCLKGLCYKSRITDASACFG
jgi:hypothetical protein